MWKFYFRFAWTIIVLLAWLVGLMLLWGCYLENSETPLVILTDSNHNKIWNYRFPAITICNNNKISLSKAKRFAKEIKPLKQDNNETYILSLLRHLVQLVEPNYKEIFEEEYFELQNILNSNNISAVFALEKVQLTCTEFLKTCSWKGRSWDCRSMFEQIITREGICCTTNYYGIKYRNFSGSHPDRYKENPRKLSSCGIKSGIVVIIENNVKDYFTASLPFYGSTVLIHDAYTNPEKTAQTSLIRRSQQVFIAVIPKSTYATDAFKSLGITDRNCLFYWENKLLMFERYSYINCITECSMKIIFEACGCIPFYFVNSKEQYWLLELMNTKFCNLDDILCTDQFKTNNPSIEKIEECNCLPDCEMTEYEIESSEIMFTRENSINHNEYYKDEDMKNISVLHVYFKDLIAVHNKRDVSMMWYYKFAWFGGILSLCMGFSFTATFEIVYNFVIKLPLDYLNKNVKVAPKPKNQKKNNITMVSSIYNPKIFKDVRFPTRFKNDLNPKYQRNNKNTNEFVN